MPRCTLLLGLLLCSAFSLLSPAASAGPLPAGVQRLADVAYGAHPLQRMDIYRPLQAANAPVLFMVHGGAWRWGDKAAHSVVDNKVARWVPQGFIFISINYPMLPEASPVEQAHSVALALAAAQDQAATWGGNADKFILMGHSAGAHLVALLNASPGMAFNLGAWPWLGTVALDSAALDVVQTMAEPHLPLYDHAFGKNPDLWRQASPLHALSANAAPLLAVCSVRRSSACAQARKFTAQAVLLHARASVLPQDLSHQDANQLLGLPGSYTHAVESFMGSLDTSVRQALSQ